MKDVVLVEAAPRGWGCSSCVCRERTYGRWIVDFRNGDRVGLCKKHLRSLVESGAKALALEEMKDKPRKKR